MAASDPRSVRGQRPASPAAGHAQDRPEERWQWQLQNVVTDPSELGRWLSLSEAEIEGIERAQRRGLSLRVTPYVLSLCDPLEPSCPIRQQVVPTAAEDSQVVGDMVDPLGEQAHEVAPHLVCRYPDRALLLVTHRCAAHCRFCTRSRLVGGGCGAVAKDELEPAFRYLAHHSQLREVIVSGGEPLTLATGRLVEIISRLRQIEHIEVIRLATRAPAWLPQRITTELCEALKQHHPLWVMAHFNHPKELTPQAAQACERLVDAGLPVMSQTVLLAGINDQATVLESLFRGLVRLRVRPYYLLHMDPVSGGAHLRTPIQRGIDIMERLQGNLSGIALPKLVVDTPGGMGKVPIGPDYVVAREPGRTTLRTYRGVTVDCLDPPAGAGEMGGSSQL
jgi:lysine 2,3-aminomutase